MLLTVLVHVGLVQLHPWKLLLSLIWWTPLYTLPTRIYKTGNLGFQEFYHLTKAESFLSYYKGRSVTAWVFYSRSVGWRRCSQSLPSAWGHHHSKATVEGFLHSSGDEVNKQAVRVRWRCNEWMDLSLRFGNILHSFGLSKQCYRRIRPG